MDPTPKCNSDVETDEAILTHTHTHTRRGPKVSYLHNRALLREKGREASQTSLKFLQGTSKGDWLEAFLVVRGWGQSEGFCIWKGAGMV